MIIDFRYGYDPLTRDERLMIGENMWDDVTETYSVVWTPINDTRLLDRIHAHVKSTGRLIPRVGEEI